MHKKSFLLFLGIFLINFLHAQNKDEVLITIDNIPVFTSEFKRVYLKNIDLIKDESQKDIDEYLDLFINYKLKLKEATTLGLDKKESYLKELEGYRKQLSSGYLTDNQASDALVKEAYDHMQERVNASHILIQVSATAAPQDTLAAYKKITEIRNNVINGANFNEQAKQLSQDPSARTNGGDLGWFSAFRMVYPFEDAAFRTEVGKISEPFRTRFGYHILKVNDREKTMGEVTVAHIMIAFKEGMAEEEAEKRIIEIKEQLHQNASFESLAKQYSDDKNTAVNGGKLTRFGQGALNAEEFEKVAFSLNDKGQISEPVKTNYGWHIIKLLEKHPPQSFEELKEKLSQKIKKDSRSELITESFINSLKEKYGVTRNEEAIRYFETIVPDSIFSKSWLVPIADKNMEKPILTLGEETYDYKNFAEFLSKKGSGNTTYMDVSAFVNKMYDEYESITLLNHYEQNLENDNQEFANVISEYRDGLLLFDLMEKKIWNAAKTDTIGLKKFYENNKNDYMQGVSYRVLKASSTDKGAIDRVEKMLKEGEDLEKIKKEVNLKDKPTVIFSEQELIKEEDEVIEKFAEEKGEILISSEDNYYTLMQVIEMIPARIKTFEETKGKVINDFQDALEKSWLEELKEKYSVKVNKKNLKDIKKELGL